MGRDGTRWDEMGRRKTVWDDNRRHRTSMKRPMVFWGGKNANHKISNNNTSNSRLQTTTRQKAIMKGFNHAGS